MTFKEAAKLLLKEKGKPLTYKELSEEAIKRELVSDKGLTPWRTMNAQITSDIKLKGPLSDFKKAGRGKFTLNDEKDAVEEEVKPDKIKEELNSEEEVEVEGGYIGKAGEHAVLSELLFRGFNASLMEVDTGVDILATKENEVFNLQVKTRNVSKRHDAYFFNIRIASFERHNSGRTFYIFLLRNKGKLDYLILPLVEIEKNIDQDFIKVVGNGKIYRVTIKERDGKICLGRNENDVTYYLNQWEVIK